MNWREIWSVNLVALRQSEAIILGLLVNASIFRFRHFGKKKTKNVVAPNFGNNFFVFSESVRFGVKFGLYLVAIRQSGSI